MFAPDFEARDQRVCAMSYRSFLDPAQDILPTDGLESRLDDSANLTQQSARHARPSLGSVIRFPYERVNEFCQLSHISRLLSCYCVESNLPFAGIRVRARQQQEADRKSHDNRL